MRGWLNPSLGASVVLFCLVAGAGCGRLLEPPPIAVSFRESVMGFGLVLGLENRGTKTLDSVEIRIQAPNGDVKNHLIDSLAPGEETEVGWKKLGGFEIPAGAEVSIRCKGYLTSLRTRLGSAGG